MDRAPRSMMPATMTRMRPLHRCFLGFLALGALSFAGCDAVDELLGRGGADRADRLRLQSIEIISDHPVDLGNPEGDAVLTSAGTIQFTAVGTFINIDANNAEVEQDVTPGVVWTSTDPTLFPGADGRIVVTGTAGSAQIQATSPAAEDVPALQSNVITLTVQ